MLKANICSSISRLKLRIQCRRYIGPHHFHTAVIKTRASVGKQLHCVLTHNLIDRNVPPYTGVVRQQVELPARLSTHCAGCKSSI